MIKSKLKFGALKRKYDIEKDGPVSGIEKLKQHFVANEEMILPNNEVLPL